MIVSTTPTLEGRRIARYPGIVTGQAAMGTNIFKDLFASITDIVGGRSGAGANAVVGVDLDYETVGQHGTMLMVTAACTAVTLE